MWATKGQGVVGAAWNWVVGSSRTQNCAIVSMLQVWALVVRATEESWHSDDNAVHGVLAELDITWQLLHGFHCGW